MDVYSLARKMVYIAGPFKAETPEETQENVDRAGALARYALRQGYLPITVHAAIQARHLGADEDSAERAKGLQAMAHLNRIVGALGGQIWLILRDNGTLSAGVQEEYNAYQEGAHLGGWNTSMRAYTWAEWQWRGVTPLRGEDPVTPPDCRACGACCIGFTVEVYPSDDQVPQRLTEVVAEDGGCLIMRTKKKRKGECTALRGTAGKSCRCSIYERRPTVCREFAPGSWGCLQARARLNSAKK